MKKILVFTLMFYIAFVYNVFAHTGLESSSPQNGEVIKEELNQITLTFETKIEQGSTFELQKSTGEPEIVEDIALSENVMVGRLKSPLKNGDYTVIWNIIGADGHATKGQFTFTVAIPVTEEPTPSENQGDSSEDATPQSTVDEEKAETAPETDNEEIQQNKLPAYVIPVILGIVVMIAVGSFLTLMKRKR
jgi:methionine-rich copper-binding protein CopC